MASLKLYSVFYYIFNSTIIYCIKAKMLDMKTKQGNSYGKKIIIIYIILIAKN